MGDINPWNTRSEEEEADNDLLFIEEGDEDKMKRKEEAINELKEKGMFLVSGNEWKEPLQEILTSACTKNPPQNLTDIYKSLERAGKATCLVLRRTNSKDREKKAGNSKGGTGCGTGFLMHPKSIYGWLVITNNHVIMDDAEAESAEILFDHLDDNSRENTKRFVVEKLVAKDLRTESGKDVKHLDFSVLALQSNTVDDKYLSACALPFEETVRVQAAGMNPILDSTHLDFVPLVAFSHPKGFGKRLSIGKYPNNITNYPVAHIKHKLPTTHGSSGANLLCFALSPDQSLDDWRGFFLHYRHYRAVAWQAIGPMLREQFSVLSRVQRA